MRGMDEIIQDNEYLDVHCVASKFRSRAAAIILTLVSLLQPLEAYAAQSCQMATTVCTDATPCKTISGVNVCLNWVSPLPANSMKTTASCWASTGSYECVDAATMIDGCATLQADPNCGIISSTCMSTDSSGNCLTYSRDYQCQKNGGVTTSTDCSGQTFCSNGTCFTKKDKPNNALVKVVTASEIARQAGYYIDPATQQIFKGINQACTINTLGLANCCKPQAAGGSFTDALIAQNLIEIGWNRLTVSLVGSFYTFDTLFDQAAGFLNKEFSGIQQTVAGYTGYDLKQATTSGPVQAGAALGGMVGGMIGQQLATSLLCSSCSPTAQGIVGGLGMAAGTIAGTYAGAYVGAAAYAATQGAAAAALAGAAGSAAGSAAVTAMCMPCLAMQVAVIIVMALLACDPSEVKTEMMLGANMCHFVGSYCSTEIPFFGCLTTTNSYCCYNSLLSKIVNEQGRPQIGKGWGGAQGTDCSGFTIAQVQQLNFAAMDFSAFYSSVIAQAMPNSAQLSAQAAASMNSFYTSTGGQATVTNGVIPQPSGFPVTLTINPISPAVPVMPTCTTTVALNAPLSTGDQSGVISLSNCQPSGTATFNYSGSCLTLQGTSTPVSLGGSGIGSATLSVPSACASSTNTWDIFVMDSGNNLLGKVSVTW